MIAQVQQILDSTFPGKISWPASPDMPCMVVPAADLHQIVSTLYNDASLGFQFLTDITAIHYPERQHEEICVVYHLHQLAQNMRLRIKVYVPIDAPNVPSIVDIFSGANWMERETYDFFGVNFEGHPNLVRILNADEMDYFPMRKEYPMEDPTRMDKDDDMFGRGNNY